MATTYSPTTPPRIQDAQALALARIAATATLGDQLGLSGALSVAEYAGYGPDALYESLLTLLPYMGYPRTVHALISFQQLHPTFIAARGGTSSEPWSSHAGIIWPDRGQAIFSLLWGAGAQQRSRLHELSPELADWLVHGIYGRIFGRPGLTLLERELLVIGCLLALGSVKELGTHRRALLLQGGHEGLLDLMLEDLQSTLPPGIFVQATDALARLRR